MRADITESSFVVSGKIEASSVSVEINLHPYSIPISALLYQKLKTKQKKLSSNR